jgi:hypothetical protein
MGGIVEVNRPVHELYNQDEPGPGEWRPVAQRIVLLRQGATAIVERITTLIGSNADPKPPKKPHTTNNNPED